ncbi:hypothetical protein ACJBT4_10510, partial [Streptococcus suis]
PIRLMRTEFALSPTSNCLPDSLSCAGVGVKQSGDRLFQLNNLKRKIVDELFSTICQVHQGI